MDNVLDKEKGKKIWVRGREEQYFISLKQGSLKI